MPLALGAAPVAAVSFGWRRYHSKLGLILSVVYLLLAGLPVVLSKSDGALIWGLLTTLPWSQWVRVMFGDLLEGQAAATFILLCGSFNAAALYFVTALAMAAGRRREAAG